MASETEMLAPDEQVCRHLAEQLLAGEIEAEDIEQAKTRVCSEFDVAKVPRHAEIVDAAPEGTRERLQGLLQRKPVRTASGVSPVAIMTSPHGCPHGKCLYCPGGPASEFSSSQSYTGQEPAAARAIQNEYDPYGQVRLRLEQLRRIGHPIEKIELILMGGTMTARSHDYQEWFVKRAYQALNQYDAEQPPAPNEHESFGEAADQGEFSYLEDVIARNERADRRAIGTTFETKPDWCDPEQIDRMLRLGGTKVEVGVQTTYERINREMHRGHGVQASIDASRRLRNAAFKVGYHMMPGQPGMSEAMCLEDFRELFANPNWRPDYLKIYPTLVVRDTVTYDMWRRGEYEPLRNEEAAELIARIKAEIPRYVRLQRVQRDIPADHIDAGVWKSNLRQLAQQRMAEHGWQCDCIRCREVGLNEESPENVEMDVLSYGAGGGEEQFISIEDFEKDLLVGFCRLRFPDPDRHERDDGPIRRELTDAALVRELHVYGNEVGVGEDGAGEFQHEGFGRRLLAEAERRARAAGFERLAVISGIGVREYYREKLGYVQDGPYVSKRL